MNKKIIFGLVLIFIISFPSLVVLNNNQVNALEDNYNNQFASLDNVVFDKDLQDYINNPLVSEIPIIITFKEDISSSLGWDLINIQAISSLELKYIFT